MRLVLRILFFEFALSWAMVLAGWVGVAVQVRPFLMSTLTRHRHWRAGLGVLIALPVTVGWPLLFRFPSAWGVPAHGDWLNVALPWWVLVGACGSLVLAAKACARRPGRELRTGCRCGTCMAYGR